MKFFVDTADTKDIADLAATGLNGPPAGAARRVS